MESLKRSFKQIRLYPTALAGILSILLMFIVAIYTIITIPYEEAIDLWRGGEDIWYRNPRNAAPAWFNYFSSKKQPVTFTLNSANGEAEKTIEDRSDGTRRIHITYTFDFNYDNFPQEMILYFATKFDEKQPFVSLTWFTPDGREIRVADFGVGLEQTYRFSQDEKLMFRLKTDHPQKALFILSEGDPTQPVKGTYKLVIAGVLFEPGDIDAELVVHGTLYGIAGTDHLRRDLSLPLLWGTPVALIFGLAASLGTSILTMIIAAIGAWHGGWVDGIIQRITEVNLVLPFLSILIMIGTFYSRSIWVILGATILLNIFTGSIKGYRAIFMQVKESSYIEAARAYGASDLRIILRYLIPRMIPTLIPGLVSSIPAFVFLEASLAVLGLGDPVLPTWGKIINDAQVNDALYKGFYYWILEPAVLLMITGLGFAMLGFALDRIFNPRLREM